MRIEILSLQVVETVTMRDDYNIFMRLFMKLFRIATFEEWHFDVVLKIKPHAKLNLLKDDQIELPNKVRLTIWSVDRFNIIRAKTVRFVSQDLRKYTPIEAHLVYPRTFGHLNDKQSNF